MDIIINDKSYYTLDLPNLPNKSSKRKTLKLELTGEFLEVEVSDIIIAKGYKYQWIFKGCKLVKNIKLKNKGSWYTNEDYNTELTISYEERSGSHLEEIVKSDIRDWSLRKILP